MIRMPAWVFGVLGVPIVAVALWFAGMLPSGAAADQANCAVEGIPTADVLLCEDFSGGAENRWDVGSRGNSWDPSQFVLCREDFGFRDHCAAWSNHLLFDREWGFYGYHGRRSFSPQPEFYVRWYQYISDPFTWGTLEDKSVLLRDPAETLMVYVGTNRNHLPAEPNSGPGVPFIANYQDLDWKETSGQFTRVNRFQNQGRNIALQPGRWYLFEWHVRLNTPGVADGVTRLWIDDASLPISQQTLRMHHTDMRWLRRADAGKQFGVLLLTVYHQRCDGEPNTCPPNGPATLTQSHRWDEIVISKVPVGPIRVAGDPVDRTTHSAK
jgi:hypothetical protein